MPRNTAVQVSLKVGFVVQRAVVKSRHLWTGPNVMRMMQNMGKEGGSRATASANEMEIKRVFHNTCPGFTSLYRSSVHVLDTEFK